MNEQKPQTPLTDAEQGQYVPDDATMYVEANFVRSLELKLQEAENNLRLIGDMAVVDWDDTTVGKVDAVVKGHPPQTYIDKVRNLYKRAQETYDLEIKLQAAELLIRGLETTQTFLENENKEFERQRDEALSDLRAHEINRPQTIPPERRFWARVNKRGSIPKRNPALGNCWEWLGAKNNFGYGMFWLEGKIIASSRVSWKFAHGEIPKLHTLHHCDNRACVNPSHLYLGTPKKNAHDRESRNRGNHTRGKDGKYSPLPHVQAKKK